MRIFSSCSILFLLSFILAGSLSGQPQVAYIIPDIGAPGMNTYVEIVGRHDATGTFGADGIYFNNPGDNLRVVATGPNAADVIVGPLVVSWNGRLISTHVFVKPGAAANRIVQLIVQKTGESDSPPLEFTIVNPVPLSSAAGGVLGQGSLGQRSKRGAMIVSSLTLNGGSYTVSTNETDNVTAGNQGYLPFILISQGPVTIGSGVTISANGNGRDGGPGGGGGGGQVCDAAVLGGGGSTGTDGGSGYAAGGEGGRNNAGVFTGDRNSVYQNKGTSSGANGASLNGASAGFSREGCTNPEGSGGGTGHPFGRGGDAGCFGNPSGQYGGGAPGGQNSGGGGGSFGANGANGTGGSQSGGRITGNNELVPLAGGSGGGSGNPQGNSVCSGSGGGGGGAIGIFSMDRMAMQGSVSVNGAQGGAPGGGQRGGGGGSGGGIILGAKVNVSAGGAGHTANAGAGGSNGGGAGSAGRTRYDGFVVSAPSFSPATGYVGPTTDTTTTSLSSTFTLTGTRGGTNNIRVYMRGDNTNWTLLGAPAYTGRTWSLNVTTPGGGNFYFAAFQEVPAPNNGQYTAEPSWVTSQVAANIVNVVAVPMIEMVLEDGSFGNPGPCPLPDDKIVVRFKSVGAEVLNVRAAISGAAPGVFTIIAPPGITALPSGLGFPPSTDEFTITVRANYIPGTHIDTLWLYTNDPRPGFGKIGPILLTITREQVAVTVDRDTIDFGQVCINTPKDDSLLVRFTGNVGQYNVDVIGTVSAPFYQTPAVRSPIVFSNPDPGQPYDSTARIPFRFRPTAVRPYFDSILIRDECGGVRTIYIRGEGFRANLTTVPTSVTYRTLVNTFEDRVVLIVNNEDHPVTVSSGTIVSATGGFAVVDPPNLDGTTIGPRDTLRVTIRFSPTATTSYSGRLDIKPAGPCDNVPSVSLIGYGVERCLQTTPVDLSLMADSCSIEPKPIDTTLVLENCGGLNVELLEAKSVNGKLTVNLPGATPFRMGTSVTANAQVTWDPVAGGSGIDTILIVWRDTTAGSTLDTLRIPVTLTFDRAIVELTTVTGDTVPPVLDLGGVYQCSPARDTVVLVNAGTVDGEITGGFTTGARFTVDPPLPFFLEVGESKQLVITLDPSSAPDVGTTYTDSLVLRNGKCDQEWTIGVTSTRYELTFDVGSVNFGGTNLNLPRTQTVTFINTTDAPPTEELLIESVYVDPPAATPPFEIVDPSLVPARVQADSGRIGLQVSFTPDAEQVYNGRLCFHIVEPCDTVICVDMTGEGIRSNIYVPQGDLNFGDVYYCSDSTLGLTIYSVGPVNLWVDSIRIVGPDRAGFELVSISKMLRTELDPGFPDIVDSINVAIRFVPSLVPPDGPKTATLEIYSDDSAQGLLEIPLLGNRISPVVVGPALVDYGTVVVNAAGAQPVTLTNTSRDTIRIVNPRVNPPFRITSALPLVIPPGESIAVNVEFRPVDSRTYDDTLIGLFALPCAGEVRVPLTGEGLRGATVISIPTTVKGEPRERISIPIVLEQAESIAEVGATTFRARIRFNASMLLPVELQFEGGTPKRAAASGGIISRTIDGADRVIEVEITNDPLPAAPDTLGWVDAVVLLGDAVTTPIAFDTLFWTDGEVATTTNDGQFELSGYCQVGNDRLIRVEGAFGIKAVTPNPLQSDAEIEFETVENGRTTLEIYDLHGARVATLLDTEDLPVQAHLARWNAGDRAAGVYYAVLTTPTQRSVRRLVLVK